MYQKNYRCQIQPLNISEENSFFLYLAKTQLEILNATAFRAFFIQTQMPQFCSSLSKNCQDFVKTYLEGMNISIENNESSYATLKFTLYWNTEKTHDPRCLEIATALIKRTLQDLRLKSPNKTTPSAQIPVSFFTGDINQGPTNIWPNSGK